MRPRSLDATTVGVSGGAADGGSADAPAAVGRADTGDNVTEPEFWSEVAVMLDAVLVYPPMFQRTAATAA